MALYNKYSLWDVFVSSSEGSRDRSRREVGMQMACAYFASLVLQYGSPRNLNRSLKEMLKLAAVSEGCKSVIRENLADDWEKIVLQFGGCSQQECKTFLQEEIIVSPDSCIPSFWNEIILELLSLKKGDRFAHVCFEEGIFLSKLLEGIPESLSAFLMDTGKMTALTEMRLYASCSQHEFEVLARDDLESNERKVHFSKIFFGNIVLSIFREDFLREREITRRQLEKDAWANLYLALEFLEEGGTCVALLLERELNSVQMEFRKKIFEKNTIECVLTLPALTATPENKMAIRYSSYASRAVLVVIRKSAPKADHKLMLVDAKDVSVEMVVEALRQRNASGILKGLEEKTIMVSEAQLKEKESKFSFLFKIYQSLPQSLVAGKTLRSLGDVAEVVRGPILSSSWRDNITDVPPSEPYARYARLADIDIDGGMTPSLYIPLSQLNEREKRSLVSAGTVIVGRVGRPLKYTVLNLPEGEMLFLGSNFYAVKCKENELDPYYFSLFLATPLGMASIEKILMGDSAMPSISIADLKSLQVSCPPIEEQRKLAAQYKKILSTIEEKQKEIDACRQKLKELAETL